MDEREYDVFHEEIEALVNEVGALCLGRDPQVIGAALAALTAMWVVSHGNPGSEKLTERMHAVLLDTHIKTIQKLIPIEHALVTGRIVAHHSDRLQ